LNSSDLALQPEYYYSDSFRGKFLKLLNLEKESRLGDGSNDEEFSKK
jgi:hypothetical protein